MIKHGFSYADLKEMSIEEIRFWAKELDCYYEKLEKVMEGN